MKSIRISVTVFVLILLSFLSKAQVYEYPFLDPCLSAEERVDDLVGRLTLKEKIDQMSDYTPAIERLGVPEYNWWNECLHGVARAGNATSFPQAIGMGATWNPQLIKEVADAISTEARAKYNYNTAKGNRKRYYGLTMWTPNINIFRDPRWGRGQETYGEDPYLTSRIGVAFVKGLQGNDPNYFKVIATPKHFAVHSGPEPARHYFDAYANKRDLWETYLPAFEACIVEGGAFSIMAAYNRYMGEACTASPLLLNDILRKKWGFKGYVVSDCGGVNDIYKDHKIVETAEEAATLAVKTGCDLNCGFVYKKLANSVEQGLISEKEIDVAVKRLFLARIKLGMFDPKGMDPYSDISIDVNECEEHQDLALKAARESIVLLKNDNNILPLSKNLKSISVVGPNANNWLMHLGNYFGIPSKKSSILEGIQSIVSEDTEVNFFKGCNMADESSVYDIITKDYWDNEGMEVEVFNGKKLEGEPVVRLKESQIDFNWESSLPFPQLNERYYSLRIKGTLAPKISGEYSIASDIKGGGIRLFVNGKLLIDNWKNKKTKLFSNKLELKAGEKYEIKVEYRRNHIWHSGIQLVWSTPESTSVEKLIDKVSQSDAIVFVGGISADLEGEDMKVEIDGFEGGDRTHLRLPKVQLDLLKELKKTGKPVVFVMANGSALAINWADKHVDAIVETWYPGQAGGQAIAEVLFGDYNPGGRLPVTFYKSVKDLPPFENYNMAGRTYRYFEGTPLYAFGHGLSYSEFTYSKPVFSKRNIRKNDSLEVKVKVRNTGNVDGDEVVQLYVADKESSVPKAIKSLRRFKRIHLQAGEEKELSFTLNPADFSLFDKDGNSFVEAGEFKIAIGGSSETNNSKILIIK